jgi:hypothetical protein
METIPARATTAQAYRVLLTRFPRLLGALWLPAALYAAGAVLFLPLLLSAPGTLPDPRHLAGIGTLFAAGLLVYAVLAVSAARIALDIERDWFLAHFRFGAQEMRFFFAILRLLAILAGIVAGIFIIAYTAAWAVANFDWVRIPVDARGFPLLGDMWYSPALSKAVIAVTAVAFGAALYAGLRFGFLLAPIAASEEHASLKRAWALSAGQFWRMLTIVLGTALPVWLLTAAIFYFAIGANERPFYLFGVAADQRAAALADMAGTVAANPALFIALKAAGLFLFVALIVGGSAEAYRAAAAPPSERTRERTPAEILALGTAAPVAIAAAAAHAPAHEHEPAIERSLLDQFGAQVHDKHLPPVESHAIAPHDDILELDTFALPEANQPFGNGHASTSFGQKHEEHAPAAHAPMFKP